MPPLISHTSDEIERARTLYEDAGVSPRDVAAILGIGVNTFYRRVKHWGWRRRRRRIAEVDAAAREAALSRDAAAREVGERVLAERLSALERARATAVAQLDALRATQERVAQAAAASVDGERSARALNHLTRALVAIEKSEREEARAQREAAAEELTRRNAAAQAREDRDIGDIDAFRIELARRLDALRRQHEGTDAPAVAAPGEAPRT